MLRLTTLALSLLVVSLSLPSTSAIFPFVLQCESAPWPIRAQPAWQTTTRSIVDTQNDQTFRPGSMILYGGVGSNDIWITRPGAKVGTDWYLIGGIVRDPLRWNNATMEYEYVVGAPGLFDELSSTPRTEAAACEDPTGDAAYIISGTAPRQPLVLLQDVWRTDDGREWQSSGQVEMPARSRSSCVVLTDRSIVVTAGLDKPYQTRTGYTQDSFNDVWRSTSQGLDWKLQTGAAAFAPRSKTLMLAARTPLTPTKDVVWVLGGNSAMTGNNFYNDVWATSDQGATWAQLTDKAPWPARWGHSGVMTTDGVLVFFGGTVRDDYYDSYNGYNYAYYGDVWTSFDGGYSWYECSEGRTVYNRTEAAVSLDSSGYFMMAAGYSLLTPRSDQHAAPVQRWNSDVVRSSFSLERDDSDAYDQGRTLARICGADYPSVGPGLRSWPSAKWNASGGAVAGIVCITIFIAILFFGYLYTRNSVKQHGVFQWPSSNEIKRKVLTVTSMPDVSFLTNLPLAEQFRQTGEGQTNTNNNLSEGLLGESDAAEGVQRTV